MTAEEVHAEKGVHTIECIGRAAGEGVITVSINGSEVHLRLGLRA